MDEENRSGSGSERDRQKREEITNAFRRLEDSELGKAVILRGFSSAQESPSSSQEPGGADAYILPTLVGTVPAYPGTRIETEHLVLLHNGRMVIVALPQTNDPLEVHAYLDAFARNPARYVAADFAHPRATYTPPPDINNIEQLVESFGFRGTPSSKQFRVLNNGSEVPQYGERTGLIVYDSQPRPKTQTPLVNFPGYVVKAVNQASSMRSIQDQGLRDSIITDVNHAFRKH